MTPLNVTAADLMPLLPELTLVGAAFALLMLDLFVSAVWSMRSRSPLSSRSPA
jgi:hypothetical protein